MFLNKLKSLCSTIAIRFRAGPHARLPAVSPRCKSTAKAEETSKDNMTSAEETNKETNKDTTEETNKDDPSRPPNLPTRRPPNHEELRWLLSSISLNQLAQAKSVANKCILKKHVISPARCMLPACGRIQGRRMCVVGERLGESK